MLKMIQIDQSTNRQPRQRMMGTKPSVTDEYNFRICFPYILSSWMNGQNGVIF